MLKKQFLFLSALFALNLGAKSEPLSEDSDHTNEPQANEETQDEPNNRFTIKDIAKIVGVVAGATVVLKIADELGLVTKEKAKRSKILAVLEVNSPILDSDKSWYYETTKGLIVISDDAKFQSALDKLVPTKTDMPAKQLKIAKKIVANKLAKDKAFDVEVLAQNLQGSTTKRAQIYIVTSLIIEQADKINPTK